MVKAKIWYVVEVRIHSLRRTPIVVISARWVRKNERGVALTHDVTNVTKYKGAAEKSGERYTREKEKDVEVADHGHGEEDGVTGF